MLGSNPSADSVASTDRGGDATASPLSEAVVEAPLIGRGTKALNPGGAGAKPPAKHSPTPFFPSHPYNAQFLRCNARREATALLEPQLVSAFPNGPPPINACNLTNSN